MVCLLKLKKFQKKLLKKKRKNLNKYEGCKNNFKDILININTRENSIKKYEKEFEEKSGRLKELENLLNKENKDFEKTKEDFNNKEKILFKCRELNRIIEIKKIGNEIPGISEKYEVCSKNVKELEGRLEEFKNKKQKILKEINSL